MTKTLTQALYVRCIFFSFFCVWQVVWKWHNMSKLIFRLQIRTETKIDDSNSLVTRFFFISWFMVAVAIQKFSFVLFKYCVFVYFMFIVCSKEFTVLSSSSFSAIKSFLKVFELLTHKPPTDVYVVYIHFALNNLGLNVDKQQKEIFENIRWWD